MKEQTLLEYFKNQVTIDELAEDLKGAQQKTGYDTTAVYISPIDFEGSYFVTKDALIDICDQVLNGKLQLLDLNTIAFALITSDYFSFDNPRGSEEVIENVIHDWDNPEMEFPLTIANVALWKEYLQTGVYLLGRNI